MNMVQRWKRWAQHLRLQTIALSCAYKDPMTPWYAKLWGALVVAYALSPIDLIPDFIPILGYLDDLILIPLGVALAVKLIPGDVMDRCVEEARARLQDKRPVNWVAGGVIIAIWIIVLGWVVYTVFIA